ncbi:MAG: serine protease [Betaproteobacteria bacterium]|nr:serine protease [Betaproteobacteria bacterium]MDE2360983.1 serine protease [Betaproteobacteria bacterium]
MSDPILWAFPTELQPDAAEVDFDLAVTLDAVVGLRAEIPDDAFTASSLGTGRSGNGVVIGVDGLVLTIGYLITEAESIWLTTNSGMVVPGHALAYDPVTGLGLVLPLGSLGVGPIARSRLDEARLDGGVYVVGRGGCEHALRAQIFARREFAGYWEYLLDEALFTTPAHPEWSGAALLDGSGRLVGIGSLFVQEPDGDEVVKGNMFVPSELIDPILDDMLRLGRADRPPRAWLGVYSAETRDGIAIRGLAQGGPAERAGVQPGDIVRDVAGAPVDGLAGFYRSVWSRGPAGTPIPLTLSRDGRVTSVTVSSVDRSALLRKPSLQ